MNIYQILVLGFYVGFFVFDFIVDVLNVRKVGVAVPNEFLGVYDEEKYRKSQLYLKDRTWFSLIQAAFMTVFVVAAILLGWFNVLDIWVRGFGFGELWTGVVYILALGGVLGVFGIPFSLYSTFVIEEKYGFNKTTPAVFFTDLLKSLLIMIVLGALILSGILWFFNTYGVSAWIWVWAFVVVVQLFMMYLAPVVLMPLFNRFEPIEDGVLKERIEAYAADQGFELSGIFTMDGSKRSSKSNAFFTGFGSKKRIVLFDTLIEKHTTDELLVILAHEMGHYRLKHIHKHVGISIVSTGLMFYLFSFVMNNVGLAEAFQMQNVSIYTSLVFFSFLFQPLSTVMGILGNALSRKHEFEADAYAVFTTGLHDDLIEGLKRLSVDNLSNLTPHGLKVFLEYSHPPVLKRIESINALK